MADDRRSSASSRAHDDVDVPPGAEVFSVVLLAADFAELQTALLAGKRGNMNPMVRND